MKKLIAAAALTFGLAAMTATAQPGGGKGQRPPPRPRPNTETGPAHRANTPNERTDARQNRQGLRIEEGINKGYLTPAEVTKLDNQQKSIETMQQSFASDGKVTRNEAQQLRQQLDEASRCIFAEKHDADGVAKPLYRLGENVILKNDIAQKLGDENLPKPAARAILNDFHRMMEIKRILATATLNDAKRAQFQAEYNKLVNTYFVTK